MQAAKRVFYWVLLIAMIAWPIVVLALPATAFDHGPKMCVSKILLDQECPGCGMTRACMRLAHGQVEKAADFNRMAIVAFPLLCLIYAAGAIRLSEKLGLPVPKPVLGALRKLNL
jgi:hypothetical protein